MKIKLNTKQIADLRREIKQSDRRDFDVTDVSQVFRMLQYWAKSVGNGEEKIKSVAELPDGYLCRVNKKFHDTIKRYLKDARARRFSEQMKERKVKDTLDKYERLIEEAEGR